MKHLLAAVDLGSNSFRLVIGRVASESDAAQIYPIDRMKETVRLAAGLDADHTLDEPAILRALAVLERFGERLRNFHPDRVRAVATNTFRVASNVREFLPRAEQALGFPIEIIAGREEARLIYAGVAHSLPPSTDKRLIIDIGGGSTEFIIGSGFQPEILESLYMGCVGYSSQYFPDGKIDASRMKRAEIAARQELQAISRRYRKAGWKYAYGSSGTAKALAAILPATGLSSGGITREGLDKLRERLIRAGTVEAARLVDIKDDRAAVLPGGLAIMRAAFNELDIETMHAADGALRVGVLHDLMGREAAHDTRAETVQQFMVRYEIDAAQAARVRHTALALYTGLGPLANRVRQFADGEAGETSDISQLLGWTADLHEIGLSIAHSGYHRHTAYILNYADMPGFSKSEQHVLAMFGLGHHGRLARSDVQLHTDEHWRALLCLRLAVLLQRRREDDGEIPVTAERGGKSVVIRAPAEWLFERPLTCHSLRSEAEEWRKIGRPFELRIDNGNHALDDDSL